MMEVIEPHFASTLEGQQRLAINAANKLEQEYRLWQLQQEAERKRQEYERKYYYALNAINQYKNEEQAPKWLQSPIANESIKDIYNEARRKVLSRIFTDGFELTNSKKHFTLKNLDDTYEFLSKKVEEYMNDFEILVTEKLKNKEIRKPKISNISVKLTNGLLELDISKIDFNIDELKDIIENPDYIIKDTKHTDTGLVIKKYDKDLVIVLKLNTSDNKKKNSIITIWEIKEKRFERYLLTHKIIYKKE